MAEIRHENGQISAVYGPISSKPSQNIFFWFIIIVLWNISKEKLKKIGLKTFLSWCPCSKNSQNSAWKWVNLGRLWTNFLQTIIEYLFWFMIIILLNQKKKRKKGCLWRSIYGSKMRLVCCFGLSLLQVNSRLRPYVSQTGTRNLGIPQAFPCWWFFS